VLARRDRTEGIKSIKFCHFQNQVPKYQIKKDNHEWAIRKHPIVLGFVVAKQAVTDPKYDINNVALP
jgi:hypothetical protein